MNAEVRHEGGARPSKLIFVNRYFAPDQSATSRMVSDLAFRLAERGLAVEVVTSRQLYENPRAELPAREVLHGVTVHRVPTTARGRGRTAGRALDYVSFHAAAAYRLWRQLAPGDVVVAKTDPPLISVTVSNVARWRRALLVNWLQDVFPEVASALTIGVISNRLEGRLIAMRDRSLRRAAMNVVLSEGMRDRLRDHGIDAAGTRVIPNWADTNGIIPQSPADSMSRRRVGLTDQFVVGYSGNFGRAHEFETLLGAARLLKDDSRFVFLMTGAGAKVQDLRRAVTQDKLPNFRFQEHQPTEVLSDSLAASDVHLVSLLPVLEGLIVPSKTYGILAAGRPVIFIGDTCGDIASMIRDHDCGVTVGVGDEQQLAAELRALQASPSRVESMSKNARRLALEQLRTGCHFSIRSRLPLFAAHKPRSNMPGIRSR